MTTDRALDMALEALVRISKTQYHIETPPIESLEEQMRRIADKAITAIKQARALDKKAENARELGLDYEPVQEPWKYRRWDDAKEQWELTDDSGWPSEPVYTTPPAQPAPVQEPVAWQLIETAPQNGAKILGWNEEFGARETQMNFYGEGSIGFAAWKSGKGPKESGWNWSEPKSNWGHTWKPTHWKPLLTPFNTTPPAAQRTWVELSSEDKKIIRNNVGYDQFMTAGEYAHLVQEATEIKLKELNT